MAASARPRLPAAPEERHELAERRRADLAVLEFSLLYGEDYDPLSWALGLPSLAAVNLEKKGVTTRDALASGLKEAETYALSDYLVELSSGAEAAARPQAEPCRASPGFPLDVVERRQARISPSFFIKEFDRTNSQVLSRYDGSVSSPDPNPTEQLAERPRPRARRHGAAVDRFLRAICKQRARL